MKQDDVSAMPKYCVVCESELPPETRSHCTDTSVLAVKKEGFLTKKTVFLSLDGTRLSDVDICHLKAAEKQRAGETGTPEIKKAVVHHCRICGKKGATVRVVGYTDYYLCSDACAELLDKRVIAKAMSGYRNVMVVGATSSYQAQVMGQTSGSYYCYWCGSNMGAESIYECPVCGGSQLVSGSTPGGRSADSD